MTNHYRTLFTGTLVQDSFITLGGTDDPYTTVDSPFCLDGWGLPTMCGRPTMRGTGLAGSLIATLRKLRGGVVNEQISGSLNGGFSSAWNFFISHPCANSKTAFRQHVEINARTGGASEGSLFNLETLPPDTKWPFLLEVVDCDGYEEIVNDAREALSHWAAGRCFLGGEVARGLGWLTLDDLREYTLTTDDLDDWPCSKESGRYNDYIKRQFGEGQIVKPVRNPLPETVEYYCRIEVGPRSDGYGIDSLSIGGHASEELSAAWDKRFLAPDGIDKQKLKKSFDPDFAIVTMELGDGKIYPYIPGSSLRGPLRHALYRLLKAQGEEAGLADVLYGTIDNSARLLIQDALPDQAAEVEYAWFQHHAEDEFAGGVYGSSKFDRVAVMKGSFTFKMVLECSNDCIKNKLEDVLKLAKAGQIGIGGGQWRGHGWPLWEICQIVEGSNPDG